MVSRIFPSAELGTELHPGLESSLEFRGTRAKHRWGHGVWMGGAGRRLPLGRGWDQVDHSSRSARLPKIHASRYALSRSQKSSGGVRRGRPPPTPLTSNFALHSRLDSNRVGSGPRPFPYLVTTHSAPGNHRMTTSGQLMFRTWTPHILRRGDLQ